MCERESGNGWNSATGMHKSESGRWKRKKFRIWEGAKIGSRKERRWEGRRVRRSKDRNQENRIELERIGTISPYTLYWWSCALGLESLLYKIKPTGLRSTL
jgi:hypothetical protein